jgi:hypothetical protein
MATQDWLVKMQDMLVSGTTKYEMLCKLASMCEELEQRIEKLEKEALNVT